MLLRCMPFRMVLYGTKMQQAKKNMILAIMMLYVESAAEKT